MEWFLVYLMLGLDQSNASHLNYTGLIDCQTKEVCQFGLDVLHQEPPNGTLKITASIVGVASPQFEAVAGPLQ